MDLGDKGFKAAIINMSKELKEIMLKKIKGQGEDNGSYIVYIWLTAQQESQKERREK